MKLTIYLKSGNTVVVRGIKTYEIKNRGDDIVGVSYDRRWWAKRGGLLLKTLALSQIEAVVVT